MEQNWFSTSYYEKGLINIEVVKDSGEVFCIIDSLKRLELFCKLGGWKSVADFEAKVGFKADQIIGKAICYAGEELSFAEDEDWFGTVNLQIIAGVFNRKAITHNDNLVNIFKIICGNEVADDIDYGTCSTDDMLAATAYWMLDWYNIVLTQKMSTEFYF